MTPSALRATTKLPVVRNLLARVMDLGWLWVLPGPFHHHSGANLSTSPKWVFPLGSNSPKERSGEPAVEEKVISVAVTPWELLPRSARICRHHCSWCCGSFAFASPGQLARQEQPESC